MTLRTILSIALLIVLFCSMSSNSAEINLPIKGESGEIILNLGILKAAAYSPDGKYIATGGPLGAFLWNVENDTPQLRHWLRGHSDWVVALEFSPDGKQLVTGSQDRTAILWDVETGENLFTFTDLPWALQSLAFMPNGRQLFIGTWNLITLWDIDEGYEIQFIPYREFPITMAVSPDGKWLLTGSTEETAKLFDIETGELIRTFQHDHFAQLAAFSPDGQYVFASGGEGVLKMWNTQTGEELRSFDHDPHVIGMTLYYSPRFAISPSGVELITGNNEGEIKLWDINSGEEIFAFTAHNSMFMELDFSPDETHLFCASYDNTVKVWEKDTGNEIFSILNHMDTYGSIFFHDNDRKIIGTNWDRRLNSTHPSILTCDINTGTVEEIISWDIERISDLILCSNCKYVLIVSYEGHSKLWNIQSGEHVQTFFIDEFIDSAAVSPDGGHLVTGGGQGALKLWDIESGEEIQNFEGHWAIIRSIDFSKDGKKLLTACGSIDDREGPYDTSARVWNVETGEEILSISKHTNVVSKALFSPDGTTILTTSWDNIAALWDASDGTRIHTFDLHENYVTDAAFSPDGKIIATASKDKTTKLWDAESGALMLTLTGHTSSLDSVTFSSDGRKIATTGSDGTRIWDVSDLVHSESCVDGYEGYE